MRQLIKRKIIYTLWSILYAYGIFSLTVLIFSRTGDRIYLAVILNMVMIIVFVVVEIIEDYFIAKVEAKESDLNHITKLIIRFLKGPTFKSAMYLFYIVILIYSALEAAEPDIFNRLPQEYLISVRYGILVLIAADKFMAQVTKDIIYDYKNET